MALNPSELPGMPAKPSVIAKNKEMVEDYALRYVPQSYRKWSVWQIFFSFLGVGTAMFFLAWGGVLTLQFGTVNTLLGLAIGTILAGTTATVFAYYGAKHGLDSDLLSRGAGFGYLGSAIVSVIYTLNFVQFFAFEGLIMTSALHRYMPDVPMWVLIVASGIIWTALSWYGMTLMEKIQTPTTPIYFIGLIIIIVTAALQGGDVNWLTYKPDHIDTIGGPPLLQVIANVFALIVMSPTAGDMGRFLKPKDALKGSLLMGYGFHFITFMIITGAGAYLALKFGSGFNPGDYVVATGGIIGLLFVIMSQVRIQVTNVYGGSLALANFFARVFHWAPGRKYWVVVLGVLGSAAMFGDILSIMGKLLNFEGVFITAWVMAVVADLLVVRKLLKIGPSEINYKRPSVYVFNPSGTIALIITLVICIPMAVGLFGPLYVTLAGFISTISSFVLTVLISVLTKGKYQVRKNTAVTPEGQPYELLQCTKCNHSFERQDMVICPYHNHEPLCSLCCGTENACKEICKTSSSVSVKGNRMPVSP